MTDRAHEPWSTAEDDCLRSGAMLVAGRSPGACSMRRFRLGLTHRPRKVKPPRPPMLYGFRSDITDDLRILIETIGRCEAELRYQMSREGAA